MIARAAVAIRRATDADLDAASDLFDRVRREALPWMSEARQRPGLSCESVGEKGLFRHSIVGEEVMLAWAGADLAGLVSVHRPETYVHSLYVDLPWQRRGVGRALLAAGLANTMGAARLKCEVANLPARQFYERLGWREVARGGKAPEDWILYMHERPERHGAPT